MDFAALLAEARREARATTCASPAPTYGARGEPDSDRAAAKDADIAVKFSPFELAARAPVRLEEGVFRVGALERVHYIPDFVTAAEEAAMLDQVRSPAASWTQLRSRRLQCYGSGAGAGHGELPPWLARLAEALVQAGVFPPDAPPNHALLNEYQPGEGILGHTDGPCYEPLVACVSLGSSALFTFRQRLRSDEIGAEEPRVLEQLVLRPRSLVVFSHDAYHSALHGVAPSARERVEPTVANLAAAAASPNEVIERGVRVSITMRRWSGQPGGPG